MTWLFIFGLVISGATAMPLTIELDLLAKWFGIAAQTSGTATSELARWLLTVRETLHETGAKHPFLFYGTDWLAFGGLRGIPVWWRLIDCSFGVFGFVPLWLCRRWSRELETKTVSSA